MNSQKNLDIFGYLKGYLKQDDFCLKRSISCQRLKGALCNILVDVSDVCNTLPRPAGSNDIIIVKLKRKLQYRGHVYFESLRTNFILKFLQYLKLNNPL